MIMGQFGLTGAGADERDGWRRAGDLIDHGPVSDRPAEAEVRRDSAARPGLDEVRRYHLDRLNEALRRPGMWGGETTIRLFLDAVTFADGLDEAWRQEQQALRDRGAFSALGVQGAVAALMPGYRDHGGVAASVYADLAWRHGWLVVDRALPDADLRRLRDDPGRDRNLDEVLAEFGPPSVWIGGNSPRYSKTLAYAGADRSRSLVCLHFAGVDDGQPGPPQLVAIRHGEGELRDSFTFTPTGAAYRNSAGRSEPR